MDIVVHDVILLFGEIPVQLFSRGVGTQKLKAELINNELLLSYQSNGVYVNPGGNIFVNTEAANRYVFQINDRNIPQQLVNPVPYAYFFDSSNNRFVIYYNYNDSIRATVYPLEHNLSRRTDYFTIDLTKLLQHDIKPYLEEVFFLGGPPVTTLTPTLTPAPVRNRVPVVVPAPAPTPLVAPTPTGIAAGPRYIPTSAMWVAPDRTLFIPGVPTNESRPLVPISSQAAALNFAPAPQPQYQPQPVVTPKRPFNGVLFDFDNTLMAIHAWGKYGRNQDAFLNASDVEIRSMISTGTIALFKDFVTVANEAGIPVGIASYGSRRLIEKFNNVLGGIIPSEYIITPSTFVRKNGIYVPRGANGDPVSDGTDMRDQKEAMIAYFAKLINVDPSTILLVDDDLRNTDTKPLNTYRFFKLTYHGSGLTEGNFRDLIRWVREG